METKKMIEYYVRLREKKTRMENIHKEAMAPIRSAMLDLENRMLGQMNEMGVTSLSAKGVGTAYQTTRVSASVADRDAFRQFCEENDMWELADIRAGKTAIRERLNDTGELPPGINWREDIGVNFKK